MRIAVNTRFLLPNMEGIGRYTFEVTKRLVKRHPDVEFLFLFDRPIDPQFAFEKNVKTQVLFPPARHPFLWYVWFEFAVAAALKKWKADVFFSPDGYLSLRSKVPTVMVTHDLAFLHFPKQVPFLVNQYYRHFTPKYLAKAAQIIAVSEFTKQDIIKQYGLAPSKIAVSYNGCREVFKPQNAFIKQQILEKYTDGKPYILYLGAIHPRKNVDRLIAAFDQFKKTSNAPHHLLIGGRFAWQTGAVLSAFQAAEHQKAIQFLDFVAEEELPKLMGSAAVFIYPSQFEGFGVPVLEAMQSGVPVITSNMSSLPEVAGDGAILVDPQSVEAMSQALLELAESPKKRQILIQNALTHSKQFTWERTTGVVEKAIFDLLKKA